MNTTDCGTSPPYNADQIPTGDVENNPVWNDPPLLITVREAGKLLGIGKTATFALLSANVLERRRIGGATRVTLRSVRKLAGV